MKNKMLHACTAFFLCLLPLSAQDEEPQLPPQHNFTIIQGEHNHDLNPQTASYSSEAQILTSLYEGLFSYNPETLAPLPAIAESYRISRNKRRWTFILRSNIKFSDGTPITAEDVRASWLSLLSTKNALYASLFDIVTGAKEFRTGNAAEDTVGIFAKDEKTLVVQLNTPAAHFSRLLCHHAFSVINKDLSVASGAYYLAERDSSHMILKKNEYYWDKDSVHIPQITINLSDNDENNTFDFNDGNADWIDSAFTVNKLLNQNAVQLNAEFGTQYLFFKAANSPWNNADFRMALLTAVPWEKLRKDYLIKADTFIYPLAGYPAVNGFSYTDSDEALELMKEARKKANIPEDKSLKLVFSVMDSPYSLKQAELLKSSWEVLGVDLVIQPVAPEKYLTSIQGSNADLFSYSWIGDFSDPLTFLELFRGGSTLNMAEYKNEKYDSLLDAAAADNSDNHFKLLSEAEQLLLDDGMILPVSHPVSLNAIDLQSVGGWTANSLDVHPFKYLYFKSNPLKLENIVMK